ncbi:phosphoglycerate kinase [Candidatus Nomurabacteria bacterium RIFCSPLOWO2_01_FULL_40_15]|uniref:Phosphoglycerate kinase n=1 Tax=Candidatus Nomurabacteria bacterium RIFCSPLOWO2_01_FULL_40_15 TaxID=1801772 RepID=A0A1F6X7U1_9BACT|nr:MAG: phosphoglycerate kinase [Candidatus Nomurabacteria bacterium RIFCSPLOWO2_01_FULL_40_15]
MRSIESLKNISGKKVLVRVDFNVPVENDIVLDTFKIRKALPTINFLIENKAKLILISHLGKEGKTLEPVAEAFNKFVQAQFIKAVTGPKVEEAVEKMKDGEVILLENLRTEPGEQANDPSFAASLAKLADIYVNEAFPVSHREAASVVLLPKLLPAYAGIQLQNEINNLSVVFENKEHPFLFILGGAKFSTKMPLIEKYLNLADHIFVAGALSNDFLKAGGHEVGMSLTDGIDHGFEEILKNKKIIVPEDVVTLSGDKLINKMVIEIEPTDTILDIGDETIKKLEPLIKNAKLILWNGPLGKYEAGGEKGTKKVLKLIADSSAKSIIGGGDTVALISQMDLEKDFSFVSTGGGATLDFLVNGTLPGLKALG